MAKSATIRARLDPQLKEEAEDISRNPNRTIMKRNAEAYRAMHSELVKHHLGQFVAICNAQLVDHDSDPVALLQRVRATYPGQVILRRKVEGAPEREVRIRHPRFESG